MIEADGQRKARENSRVANCWLIWVLHLIGCLNNVTVLKQFTSIFKSFIITLMPHPIQKAWQFPSHRPRIVILLDKKRYC